MTKRERRQRRADKRAERRRVWAIVLAESAARRMRATYDATPRIWDRFTRRVAAG